jgi:predicted DsbA family dithiol-disulfide isomerase
MMNRLKQVADAEGLPLGERKKTYNSRLAQELGKWAEANGMGEKYHKAVFQAYFADGLNIGKISTLLDLVKMMGLSVQDARRVLENREFQKAVDLDWSRSLKMGVTAVPTFYVKDRFLEGAQPYGVLEQFIKANNILPRESV